MDNLDPGIFIPSMSIDINMKSFSTIYAYMQWPLRYERGVLKAMLEKAGIKIASINMACRFSQDLDHAVYFGLLLKLERPYQVEVQKAMKVINDETHLELDDSTVPFGNIMANGAMTQSVSLFVADENSLTCVALQEYAKIGAKILQSLNAEHPFCTKFVIAVVPGGFEIIGTSPALKEVSNIDKVWQHHLDRVVKEIAPQFKPEFYPTWSTNNDLTAYFLQKDREYESRIAALQP